MRQKEDPKYAAIMFGLRAGECIKEGLYTFNSRVYESKSSESQKSQGEIDSLRRSSLDKCFFSLCVHENKTKDKIIWDFVFRFAKSIKRSIILCKAIFQEREKLSIVEVSVSEIKSTTVLIAIYNGFTLLF